MTAPCMFSRGNDRLQIAWDATSLSKYMQDPALYRLEILEGWEPPIIPAPLAFGVIYHSACEVYDHARFRGDNHDDALIEACQYAMTESHDYRGMGLDEIAALGRKGDETKRNRYCLLRTLVWYAEEFGRDDNAKILTMGDGSPAIELSFRIPLDIQTPYGENYILCGHLDAGVDLGGLTYVKERKHTTATLSSHYFKRYSPNLQISTYALAGALILPGDFDGVLIDAAQTAVGFSRFLRRPAIRTPAMIDETLQNIQYWIKRAEADAEAGYFHADADFVPQNEATVGLYGGTSFRKVFATDPAIRARKLRADFQQREEKWNPLVVRN